MHKELSKIVVVLGPTASGKTELGIKIAKMFNGEVISADSRQVYKEMDVATGKPKGKWQKGKFLVNGVPHYLMDIIEPDEEFSLADYKKRAIKAIDDILARGKLPIIVGGTGLYIWSIVDNLDIPAVKPDKKLRAELESKDLSALADLLKEKDADSALAVDLKNKRRVVRALEIILASDNQPRQRKLDESLYNALQLGLRWPPDKLDERISERIKRQLEQGILAETEKLLKKYPLQLNSMSGIGYRQLAAYLNGEMTLWEAVTKIKNATHAYAKRQITWFKRDKRIVWVGNEQEKETPCKVEDFLSDKS